MIRMQATACDASDASQVLSGLPGAINVRFALWFTFQPSSLNIIVIRRYPYRPYLEVRSMIRLTNRGSSSGT